MKPHPKLPVDPGDGTTAQAHHLERRWPPRKRRGLIAVAALSVVVLLSIAGWQVASTSRNPQTNVLVGKRGVPAPAFVLSSLRDPTQMITLASFRGKELIINFWASWCVPCRTEMPLLQATSIAQRGRVAFLGINMNDTRTAAVAFLAQVRVTYPSVTGSTAIADRYDVYGLPTTVFISPTGKVLGRHLGKFDAAALQAALRQAFPMGAPPG